MNKAVKICVFSKNTPKETVILSNGDAILDNICTSCKVTENLDGTYELDAEFIIDDAGLWEHLQEEAILKIKVDYGDEYFRITKPRKTRTRIIIYAVQVTIYETIHLWLNDVRPTGLNGTAAINWILDGAVGVKELEVYSNISASSTAYYENMNMYKAIHDCDQSFLNRWGGEIQRRGYLLRILDKVGKDRGVQIRSCKNLRGFEANTDVDSITTRIKPKGYDGITIDGFIDSPIIKNYARVYTKEFTYSDVKVKSSEDETEGFSTLEEAQDELKRLAQLEYTENNVDIINADYTIDFIDLSQTEEYKDYIKAERVYIGDEVTVFESKLNINVVVRAIERKFNVLTQKVEEIKLSNRDIGRKSININDVIIDISKDIAKNDNSIEKWIQSFINAGIKDSYVFYNNEELVVCDSPTIEEAIHVWRFNKNGLAHSANGYQGPYDVALTANGQINANMILAGTLKGQYIDARNMVIKDEDGNVTFSVGSDAIVRMIQGLIDISDEGIRINLQDSEGNIVGYVVYDGQGVQIFTNDDEPISSFHREGSYAEKFVVDRLYCPAVVQVADLNGCPSDWYIGKTATGDKTGRDQNNKADSLSTVLRNVKNYGTKFDAKLTIHIEDGCVINEKGLVIQDMMGTVFRLELGPNVVINCEYFNIEDLSSRIFIEYVSDKRLVGGEITQADYNKYPIINSSSDDSVISVRHVDYIEIRGIRFEGVEGATGIKGLAGTNLVVDDCDFFGVDQCLKADGSSNVSLGWCSGNVDKLASIYNGSILTTSRRIPKYSNEEMVYVAENATFIKSQYSYVQYDTLHSSSGSSSGGSGTNLNDVFSIPTSNLYTMVEGTGKVTSARKGYTGQGKYKTLKAHRGYIKLPITSIQSVMANKKSYTLKLKLTRLKTEHGYDSKTPHPIFRATGGSAGATDYWDSNVKFARGETQTLTLPTSIVQAIEKGADTLELWASSNQEQQYAFFGDVVLTIEGENTSQGDTDKPGTDVGSGETAYSAVGTTTANLNVRKGAGSSYAIITTLAQGTKVNIVAKDNATGWYKITYNGAYGYVSNKYITIESTGGGTTPGKDTIYDFPYADEMVEVGLTYWRVCDNEYTSGQSWSQGFTYRSANTPLSGTCKAEQDVAGSLWEVVTRSGKTRHYKAIDCSTFAGMMTKGLEYVNGPYANKTNFTNFRKNILQKSSKKWAFNMVKADGTWAREAAAQCEYFDRVGLGIVYYRNVDTGETYGSIGSSSDNYSMIKKGDLIFYSKKDSSGNWKQPNRYMKVSHVAVCYGDNSSGSKSVIESTNGTMTKNHKFDDGTTVNAGIRMVSISGDYGYADDIVMVVRPQPSHYNGNIPGGGTESGGTGGGTTGDGVTDAGTTEYTNCVSEQGTIDGNKYVYKLKTCKITAYGGDSGSACNIPLNLGRTCGSFNLPYGTKIYIPSLKGKRITDGNGKTVTCDGIFTVNDTGVGGTDFDLYMSTKSDTNAENIFGNTRREDVYILSYGSGYGYAWSYTKSYEWAYKNGTLSAYKVAFKDYIKYGGTLINFLKFKSDDKNIRNSTYWSILNS
ncbi:phage tail spike protein [Romboutsia timonensis]|jgi:phage minor structural protein|uniref:phage tail spike protein n=1 Tax=Romboutsia timonensis TaxID=1776391 RepID=UPI00204F5B56|nr:MAG TPA: tail protein [Caudoviricetes sp.]